MKRMEFKEGQTIFHQGEPSDRCFQVVSGAVDIRVAAYDDTGNLQAVTVQTLRYGEVFGEMGIIDDSPRSASAVAAEPTVCVAYTSEEIMDLLESDPKEAIAYIRTLIQRLRSASVKVLVKADDS